QAVKDFAPKPFARVSAAAFGQVLRTNSPSQLRDLGCLGHTRVVFPEPRHGCRVFGEGPAHRQSIAVSIHRQRGAARGIDTDTDDLVGPKSADSSARLPERLFDRDLGPFEVIPWMLSRQIGIA